MRNVILLIAIVFSSPIFAEDISWQPQAEKVFQQLLEKMAAKNVLFTNDFTLPPKFSEIDTLSRPRNDGCKEYVVEGDLYLILVPRTFDVVILRNRRLEAFLKNQPRTLRPSLSLSEAITNAVQFTRLVIPNGLSSDFEVSEVAFNFRFPSCWEIRWNKIAIEGFPYDDFVEPHNDAALLVFHETLGVLTFGKTDISPKPSSLHVRLSRSAAIAIASDTAFKVMETDFYRQARASGFLINGVKEASLKVSAPNWLLDPKRAIWIREKPPEEMRLCWVVRFTTTDTKSDARKGLKLIPPEILVYVDAATGEVVGANFT